MKETKSIVLSFVPASALKAVPLRSAEWLGERHALLDARPNKLGHGAPGIRLDFKKLTSVADTHRGPIPLNRMGSGANWVGFHVLTNLALHHWFRSTARPTPGFLILDQPSQAFCPPENDKNGRIDELKDEDRLVFHRSFELMHEVASEIDGGFLMIVIDHAHLDDTWFADAIAEEWRGGRRLFPS